MQVIFYNSVCTMHFFYWIQSKLLSWKITCIQKLVMKLLIFFCFSFSDWVVLCSCKCHFGLPHISWRQIFKKGGRFPLCLLWNAEREGIVVESRRKIFKIWASVALPCLFSFNSYWQKQNKNQPLFPGRFGSKLNQNLEYVSKQCCIVLFTLNRTTHLT